MIQGRVDRKEGGGEGRGRRAGKGWEWGGVLEAGRVDRKEGAGTRGWEGEMATGRGRWGWGGQRGGGEGGQDQRGFYIWI